MSDESAARTPQANLRAPASAHKPPCYPYAHRRSYRELKKAVRPVLFGVDGQVKLLLVTSAMTWRTFLFLLARAGLRVLADHLDPPGRKRASKKAAPRKEAPKEDGPRPKQRTQPKQPPQTEKSAPYAPQSAESAGWGASTAPQPSPVIRIETDEGSTVSPLSVLGDRAYVAPRVQREHKPGESRRVRRKTRVGEASREPAPPRPSRMDAFMEEVRTQANATRCKPATPPRPPGMDAFAERMRAEQIPSASEMPTAGAAQDRVSSRRRRPAGESMGLTALTLDTLLLLERGEPMTDASDAAA